MRIAPWRFFRVFAFKGVCLVFMRPWNFNVNKRIGGDGDETTCYFIVGYVGVDGVFGGFRHEDVAGGLWQWRVGFW